jgi:site-specific DNA-methyltransferase (adenine-specific)
MGKEWDGGDIAFRTEVWSECLRVLKPGGHLLAFSHSRTYHRMAVAVEDAGFEIRDQIMWIYGSGFPKSHNIGKAIDKIEGNGDWDGWGTALKPAHEPIVLARKPLSEKSIAENVIKWGTGGINIDGSRIGTEEIKTNGWGDKGFVAQEDYEGITHQGRFPANIIFDEEAGKLLGEPSRFFYCPKTSKKDRNEGDVSNLHPTVKPTDLMRYLIKLITPPNGTVLDPFMGSGSTGKGAVRDGFNFIGIEKEQEYMDIARARINHELNKPVQTKLL